MHNIVLESQIRILKHVPYLSLKLGKWISYSIANISLTHYMYNCISLGLTLLAMTCLTTGQNGLGSVFFCLALNYKQMELYHAMPFFCFLLGDCLLNKNRTGWDCVVPSWTFPTNLQQMSSIKWNNNYSIELKTLLKRNNCLWAYFFLSQCFQNVCAVIVSKGICKWERVTWGLFMLTLVTQSLI